MAVFFQGMTAAETAALTDAMLHSGQVVDLSSIDGMKIDKHSTGGVGDKVSLCLAPLAAACGVRVPMISGRGLGHTGGTLDKLEAIAGFDVGLDVNALRRIVDDVGVCMIGQSSQLAPADKRLYALRDVTATVEAIPLIVASILSKKLAAGIDGLVLDVKVGRGAFMKTRERGMQLAKALVDVGVEAGKCVTALLTNMDAPLGRAVGNAIETREAIDVLRGGGPADLVECTLALGAEMLLLAEVAADVPAARATLQHAIDAGDGARVFERMIEAQHGDPAVVEHPDRLPQTAHRVALVADHAGVVTCIDALEVGLCSVAMGAGRTRADQAIDHAVGIELCCDVGVAIEPGDELAVLHVHDPKDADSISLRLKHAIVVDPEASGQAAPLVLERVTAGLT
jgi:pyrimidine-nucleoside phosphorylase